MWVSHLNVLNVPNILVQPFHGRNDFASLRAFPDSYPKKLPSFPFREEICDCFLGLINEIFFVSSPKLESMMTPFPASSFFVKESSRKNRPNFTRLCYMTLHVPLL